MLLHSVVFVLSDSKVKAVQTGSCGSPVLSYAPLPSLTDAVSSIFPCFRGLIGICLLHQLCVRQHAGCLWHTVHSALPLLHPQG